MSNGPPELTPRSIAIGAAMGALLAGANIYAGLKTGVVDFGNVTGAVVGFALLSVIARARPTGPLETNIAQTVASSAAMMALTGGMLGPVAALVMSGQTPPVWAVVVWGIALGVAGCMLAVPMRRPLVEEVDLAFPSAVATAEIVRSVFDRDNSAISRRRVLVLAVSLAAAAAVVAVRDVAHAFPATILLPVAIAGIPAAGIGLGLELSPLLVGTGVLIGPMAAIGIAIGGAVAWLVISPILVSREIAASPEYGSLLPWLLWPGVGLMIGGSLSSLGAGLARLRDGLRALRRPGAATATLSRAQSITLATSLAVVVAIGWLAFDVHIAVSVAGIVLAVVFAGAAARVTGETDNIPAGQLAGFTQVAIGAVTRSGITEPLAAGGIVSGISSHSSHLIMAWKTGHRLGASPARQLTAQLIGVAVGAIAAGGAFALVVGAHGIGNAAMPALGPLSWKATAEVVQHGFASLPPGSAIAAVVAFVAGAALAFAQDRKRLTFLPPPVTLGFGFILPPNMALAIVLGAVLAAVAARTSPTWHERYSPIIASGAIAGEALLGLVLAALIIADVIG